MNRFERASVSLYRLPVTYWSVGMSLRASKYLPDDRSVDYVGEHIRIHEDLSSYRDVSCFPTIGRVGGKTRQRECRRPSSNGSEKSTADLAATSRVRDSTRTIQTTVL